MVCIRGLLKQLWGESSLRRPALQDPSNEASTTTPPLDQYITANMQFSTILVLALGSFAAAQTSDGGVLGGITSVCQSCFSQIDKTSVPAADRVHRPSNPPQPAELVRLVAN